MQLTKVQLQNFRNYNKAEVNLSSDLVLILGENASGKTNFLESIYYLSTLYSFRAPDSSLTNLQADFFSIKGANQAHEYEVVVEKSPKTRRGLKIDAVKVKKPAWSSFQTVLFEPSDLNLFTLGPSMRRRYLNQAISQKDKIYAADMASLEHVLKQKTALLKEIAENRAKSSQLMFWNEQLEQISSRIKEARAFFLDFLQARFEEVYKNLTGFGSSFAVEYKTQPVTLESLKVHIEAEVWAGICLIGPHRDDFLVKKDSGPNIYNSSRGELRSQVLAMKLLQAEYLSDKEKPGTSEAVPGRPVILLDDVFSELDETRRAKLIENLSGNQIFITSTEEHHLPKLKSDAQILKVENNQIK
ncbi:MAG: DNA replication and repair protein RecF [Candidatus Doudnabacteria bacterium]|nr:DNA replication and repair protein RecF [Candidatus Doudnabacteria bacterium]